MIRPARLAALLLAAATLAACGSASVPAASEPEPLPDGAIPFDYDRGHLYFDARIADSLPARLIFDTGATLLSLDSLWLTRTGGAFDGLKSGRGVLRGAGERPELVRLLLDSLSLEVDTLRWRSAQTVVHDLRRIVGRRIDGIFGEYYLDGLCVAFDYRRGFMRAVSTDTLAAAGYVRIAARKESSRIYFPMRVVFDAGHVVEGEFMLDTGCGKTAVVSTPAADRAALDGYAGRKVHVRESAGGVGGRSESYCSRAAEVTLGGHTLRDVPVWVSGNRSGVLAGETGCGIVGNALLERFDFAVDFRSGEAALWVRPAASFGERFDGRSPGFRMVDRTDTCDGWPVTGFVTGFAPEGLAEGDVVFEWDGRPIASLPDSAIFRTGPHRFRARRGGQATEYETEYEEIY